MDCLPKLAANACWVKYLSHFISVGASIILNMAGFSGMYIMSCLHWKSDAYKVYLCNINILAAKHTQAMS
jgi:hypothetical protein